MILLWEKWLLQSCEGKGEKAKENSILFFLRFPSEDYLTCYHMIPTFNTSEKEAFGKHCGKRRKCWKMLFPTIFFLPSQKEFVFKLHLCCYQFGQV